MPRHSSQLHPNHKHEIQDLSAEILDFSRTSLFLNLRYLESAFLHLHQDPDLTSAAMSTEGYFLHYSPAMICRIYAEEPSAVTRDYLHVILHCVYRHFYVGPKVPKALWNLAADIQVEHEISELNLTAVKAERETEQAWLIADLKQKLPSLTAEHILRHFLEQHLSEEDAVRLDQLFYADDHELWYTASDQGDQNAQKSGEKSSENRDADDSKGGNDTGEENTQTDDGADSPDSSDSGGVQVPGGELKDGHGSDGGSGSDQKADQPTLVPDKETLKQNWTEISERVRVDLDTFSDTYGNGAGNLKQNLKELNRESYDYRKFLKKFASLGENLETNEDEFDYIYYVYGMDHYGNMPLVEPLEYKEVKKVREIVIAIDTSESVSGNLVQQFVQKTWNMLKQTDSFFSRVNIHILQCGAKVEEDVTIKSQEDLDAYLKRMVLKGFGGTDFRPVFEKVNELIRSHAFSNFRGLIYFTDGYGTYPAMPPAYPTAFVFLDQEHEIPEVPPWAIRLVLKEDEIHDL